MGIRRKNSEDSKLAKRLRRLDQRELHNLAEGHVGQISLAILGMVQGATSNYDGNLWEAQRLTEELREILAELDRLA